MDKRRNELNFFAMLKTSLYIHTQIPCICINVLTYMLPVYVLTYPVYVLHYPVYVLTYTQPVYVNNKDNNNNITVTIT